MNQASCRLTVATLSLLLLFSASGWSQGRAGQGGQGGGGQQSQTDINNVYDLRQLTNQDWQRMSTTDRLEALGTSNAHAINQTFLGDFSLDTDLYPKWGYDYYEMEDRYQNYAFRGFENYQITNDRRNRWYYNQFGDRLTRMTTAGRFWLEQVNDDGSWGGNPVRGTGGGVGPSGYINNAEAVAGVFYVQESTDDWAIGITGAGALRKSLSPLTFSIPNYDGIAIDFQTTNWSASFLSSAHLGEFSFAQGLSGQGAAFTNLLMLRGGQIRRKFGALTIGANYANMYSIVPPREGGHGLHGSVSDMAPTPSKFMVRVLDDSPYDGNGPQVYDVRLIINGRYHPEIVPSVIMDNLENELVTAVIDLAQYNYIDMTSTSITHFIGDYSTPNIDQVALNQKVPKYVDYLYYDDYIKGHNLTNIKVDPEKGGAQIMNFDMANKMYKMIDPAGKPVEVNGNDFVVYMFDLTSMGREQVTDVSAEVTVANDYKIQVAEIYSRDPLNSRDDPSGNMYYQTLGASFWKTMAQADGNIKDSSNLKKVVVDFGYEVSNNIYGLDAHFNYLGFRIDGEFVRNTHWYQFSDGFINSGVPATITTDITPRNGEYSSISDNAYYLTFNKDWADANFGVSGEIFKMGKFYRPDFMSWLPFRDSGQSFNTKNEYIRMSMVQDNDDDDQYPDVQYEVQAMGFRYGALYDPDGVFPGKDLDNDSVPDTDRNQNSVRDDQEPFLMMDMDPDVFTFGDDLNNNTIPDVIEDDLKDDLPYDLDRQGYHLNFRYSPLQNLNVVMGSYRTNGVGLDNRNNSNYLKTIYNYNVLDIGNLNIEYRYERIKDNIVDPAMIPDETTFTAVTSGYWRAARYTSELYFDELEYRNSQVNRLFVDATLRPTPGITVVNHIRYEDNGQVEGAMYDSVFQPKSTISTLALSNKIIYTKQYGNFTVSPGVKFRLYKKDYSTFVSPRDHYLMTIPVLTLKYQVSTQTAITLGFQGISGLETDYTDYVMARNSYKQKNTVLQIENLSNYFGFDVWGAAGFQAEQITFDEIDRKFEEYKTSSLFMRVWVGLE